VLGEGRSDSRGEGVRVVLGVYGAWGCSFHRGGGQPAVLPTVPVPQVGGSRQLKVWLLDVPTATEEEFYHRGDSDGAASAWYHCC